MLELNDSEQSALEKFLQVFHEQHFELTPTILHHRIHRTPDGQIVIPISVQGESPSFEIALLMGHKAEQIYKQTACRLVLGQCPEKDINRQSHVLANNQWSTLP